MNFEVVDIHHHCSDGRPIGTAVTQTDVPGPMPIGSGLLSVGIHPWTIIDDELMLKRLVEEVAQRCADARVAAIGECGLDALRGMSRDRQLKLFREQIAVAEEFGLPIIIHSVRCSHLIMQLHRELKPSTPWVIHGFRGGATEALQFTDRGIYLSFGEKFNAAALAAIPAEMRLAETDESVLDIAQILELQANSTGRDSAQFAAETAINTKKFLGK